MIDKSLLDAIKSYSEKMTRPITFVLGSGEHSKRAELIDFLTKSLAPQIKSILMQQQLMIAYQVQLALKWSVMSMVN